MNTIEKKRAYAKEYMRKKRLDPVFREKERIANSIRFHQRDKVEYNEERKIYRLNNLDRFAEYEKNYSAKARAEGRMPTQYRKRYSNKILERFVPVIIGGKKMFWKPKNKQLHLNRNDHSDFISFTRLSNQELTELRQQILYIPKPYTQITKPKLRKVS